MLLYKAPPAAMASRIVTVEQKSVPAIHPIGMESGRILRPQLGEGVQFGALSGRLGYA